MASGAQAVTVTGGNASGVRRAFRATVQRVCSVSFLAVSTNVVLANARRVSR